MTFHDTYFEGEERCGFYISPMMKRAWAAQLEILQEIDKICTRHNIEYFADWGTLLGAVRHQGYIPWDDDLDIAMKRGDYTRFLKAASKELPEGYGILSGETDASWKGTFARVSNGDVIPLTGERLEQFHGFPYTAGIDIFPQDYIPNDKEEEEALLMLFRAAYTLAFDWDKGKLTEEEKIESLKVLEECCNVKFTEDKPYKQQLWILTDRIASMYGDTEEEARDITLMYKLADEEEFRMPVSCFRKAVRVPFENTTIPVPIDYEQVLTIYYGEDYMTPKRVGAEHDYPFYKKQRELLLEYYEENGMEIPPHIME